jgi:hypothetical protein
MTKERVCDMCRRFIMKGDTYFVRNTNEYCSLECMARDCLEYSIKKN